MPITIIAGRAGSGKSALLYDYINKLGSKNIEAVLLVPEQFTLQTERELIASGNENGFLSINVMSISSLMRNVFNTVFAPDKKVIDNRGKAAVMSLVITSIKDELLVFSKAASFSGFSSEMSELIGDFKKHEITPNKLADAIENNKNVNKIADILKIYKSFNLFLSSSKFIDSDDEVNYFIDTIPNSKQYQNTHFFIDGFERLTDQDLKITKALYKLSGNLTICVNASKNTNESIFDAGRKTITDIINLADNDKTNCEIIYADNPHVKKHPAILHLEKNLFADNPKIYKGENVIDIIYASDILQEAESTACRIIDVIKNSEGKTKYSDISILCCGNLNEYGPLLERIFARYKIPCFTHQRKSILQHPAVGYILSALSSKISNLNKNDVISMLKSVYAGIDYSDAMSFEDYILDYAIDGYLFKRNLKRITKKY